MDKRKLTHCGEIVRQYDRDRFLISLLLPAERRAEVWPVLAFHQEIARIRETVSEPLIGLIRLQWWRDALRGLYETGKAPAHPVLEELAGVIERHGLPQGEFESLMDARESDIRGNASATFMELELYAERSTAPLNRMIVKILGETEDEKTLRAVSIGYALTGLLRAAPYYEAGGWRVLPRGQEDAPALVALAEKYFSSANPSGRFLTLSRQLGRAYLGRIGKLNYNLSDARLARPPFLFVLKGLGGFF